jgi:hypothetical protein
MKTGLTIGLSLVALAAVSSEVGMWASAPDIQRERSAVEDSSRVGGWLDAVDRHVPTEIDAAATDIAAWPKDQLIPVLTALGRLNSAGAINHVLIRGAVLHTDVALGGFQRKRPDRSSSRRGDERATFSWPATAVNRAPAGCRFISTSPAPSST